MPKINLQTLAANAARAKASLIRQETLVQKLGRQLIQRVGTGGQTIQTNVGQVIITAQTETRNSGLNRLVFNQDEFTLLPKALKLQLENLGVVSWEPQTIRGQEPRVQYRLQEK